MIRRDSYASDAAIAAWHGIRFATDALPRMKRYFLEPFSLNAFAFPMVVFVLVFAGGCKSIPAGRSAVNEVQVRGADEVDEEDVADKIATSESPKFLGMRGVIFEYALFDRFVFQRDLARVEAFYRAKGYYDAHARAGRIHQLDDNHVRVEVVVDEGEAVLVRDVRVDGLHGLPDEIVRAVQSAAVSGLPKDKRFEEEEFEKTERDVRRTLTNRGYAYAKVKRDAVVDIVVHRSDAVFVVDPGPKCVFGELRIEGLGGLPERAVRRAIDIKSGDEYSQQALDDAQQTLLDLGVFASVELEPDVQEASDDEQEAKAPSPNAEASKNGSEDPNGAAESRAARAAPSEEDEAAGTPRPLRSPVVPIRIRLEPTRVRSIRLGGGIEFDALKTDIHGIVGWEHRNFLGGLRNFSVTFRPGVVLYPIRVNNIVDPERLLPEERLRIELKQPGLFEARTNGFIRPEFNVYPVLVNPDPPVDAPVIGYGEIRNSIGVERALWRAYGTLSHNTQIAYPFSYVGAKDATLDVIVISYPELYTILDFRDDKIHSRKGVLIGNTFQIAGGVFGGDAADIKVQPEVRGYIPLLKKLVFATRASVGFLSPRNYGRVVQAGPSGSSVAPTQDRTKDYQLTFFRGFFSGGPNSNRGYPIRGISPHDLVPFLTPELEAGKIDTQCAPSQVTGLAPDRCRTPTGGFTLWEASAELRYSVSGPLSVATFCDASDVSPQTTDIRLSHLHLSCGGGARYDTPAGPIRLDIGYRIPGFQVLGGLTPDEREPTLLFGAPIAVHIGIGEAY